MAYWLKTAAVLLAAAAAAAAGIEPAQPAALPDVTDNFESHRLRRLGDAALTLGDFAKSEEYYLGYLSAATARGDAAAVQDATIRRINLRLQQNKPEEAAALLEDFKSSFGSDSQFTLKPLEAEIKIMQRDYEGAEQLLRELLASAGLPSYLQQAASFSLGEVLAARQKYQEAAAVYKLIDAAAPNFDAKFREIYALQRAGSLIESQELISGLPEKELSPGQLEAAAFLKVNQAAGEKRFSEASKLFDQLPDSELPDQRRYQLALDLAVHFRTTGDEPAALHFLERAYDCAPGIAERQYVLAMLIDSYAGRHDYDSAVRYMERYLAYYPDDRDFFHNQLQLAHMLNKVEHYQGAAAVYQLLVENIDAPLKTRLQAAREAAGVYQLIKENESAEKMLRFIVDEGTDAETKADGNLLMAKFFFDLGNYLKSAEFSTRASDANTAWKFPALYVLMNAQQAMKNYNAALGTARILKTQGIDEWPQKGAFAEAKLLEASGDIQGAISAYSNFSALWSFSEMAPDALYAAGNLAFNSGDYVRSGELFRLLASRYPNYAAAPHGLYLAVYAESLQGRSAEMARLIDDLSKAYPQSQYTISALLWQLDLLKINRKYQQAETLLETMAKSYENAGADVVEQIRFEQARLASLTGNDQAAIPLLEQTITSEAAAGLRARASFTLGDLYMKFGEYAKAEPYFKQAEELAPDKDFAAAAVGRSADSYYSSGMLGNDRQLLQEAADRYEQVLARAENNGLIFYQTGYKLGKIAAAQKDFPTAARRYNNVLLAAAGSDVALSPEEAWWAWESLKSLVELQLAAGSAEALDSALKAIELAETMQIPEKSNLAELRKQVLAAYQVK